jgi:DNA mismatch repair protein MutL
LVVADYPACADKRLRVAQVLGEEFSENVHDFELSSPDMKAEGFLGSPDFTRVNRTGQKIFINGRPVVSPAINNALSRAYDEFLQPRRFPVVVLFVEIAPQSLDVNVHPAKREVRIRNERGFIDQLTRAVRASLRKRGFHVQVEPEVPLGRPVDFRVAETRSTYAQEKGDDSGWSVPKGAPMDTSFDELREAMPRVSAAQALLETEESELPFDMVKILGQLHGCYLVVEARDGFFLVDQHAAHERIVYEDLLSSLQSDKPVVQQLLFPATLNLNEQEATVLQENAELLASMGFGINDQGDRSFSVDAVPTCVIDSDAESLLQDSVHELLDGSRTRTFESHQQELAAILACKTHAVKAGRVLAVTEQLHLVRRLGACENPHACPHGRPTFIRIDAAEIEKRFLRT